NDLRVVFKNLDEPRLRQKLLPQVIGLEAVRIGRISRAVIKAFVERQEPRVFAFEVSAEPDFLIVHGKVSDAAAKLKEKFARVAVAFVLLHRVFHGLLGQTVLELEGRNRQAVEEEAQV